MIDGTKNLHLRAKNSLLFDGLLLSDEDEQANKGQRSKVKALYFCIKLSHRAAVLNQQGCDVIDESYVAFHQLSGAIKWVGRHFTLKEKR